MADKENNPENALKLFRSLGDRHSLTYSIGANATVDALVEFPVQSKLTFPLALYLDNRDELVVNLENFTASYFPCSDTKVRNEFEDAFNGLVSGRYRVTVRSWSGWYGLVTSQLEAHENGNWRRKRGYARFGLPFGRLTTTVIHNVHLQSEV